MHKLWIAATFQCQNKIQQPILLLVSLLVIHFCTLDIYEQQHLGLKLVPLTILVTEILVQLVVNCILVEEVVVESVTKVESLMG